MKNTDKILNWIAGIIIFSILIGIPIIGMFKDKPKVECLGKYAKSYCNNKNITLVKYDISGFYCAEDYRVYEPTRYKYTLEERSLCNDASLGDSE